MTLKDRYKSICEEYANMFLQKQDFSEYYWIGDQIGGVVDFNEAYSFNFGDIVYDIDTNQPKGLIMEWQDSCLEHDNLINYTSYCMGLRHKDIQ